MSSSKRAFGGLFWTITGNLLNAFYGLLSVPILLAHFGREEYGLIGLSYSINLWLNFMDMGISGGNIKFFSQWIAKKRFEKVSRLFQSSLVFYGSVGLANALVLGIVAFFAARLWHLNPHEAVVVHDLFYILMVSAFVGWISSLFDQFLRANEIIGWEARLQIFIKIILVVLLYLTIHYNYSVVTYVMLSSFTSLLILPFTIIRIKKLSFKVSFIPRYYNSVFKSVLPYSLSIFCVSIFQFSANNLRPVLLSLRAGIGPVADFRVLNAFGSTISVMSVSFVGVLLPMASKALALGNTGAKDKIAYDATKYLSIFLSIIVFGFVLVSTDVLHALFGDKYVHLAFWLNVWVLTLLLSHNSAISSLVFAENKLRPIVYISAFSAITSLTLGWFLSPTYQVGGMVMCYLYYSLSQITFAYVYYYRKILKLNVLRILLKCFLKPTASMGICALLTYFAMQNIIIDNQYLRILLTVGFFLVLATPVVFLFILNVNDKTFLKGLLIRAKKLGTPVSA